MTVHVDPDGINGRRAFTSAKSSVKSRLDALHRSLVQTRGFRLALTPLVALDDQEASAAIAAAEKAEEDALELLAELFESFTDWKPLPQVVVQDTTEGDRA